MSIRLTDVALQSVFGMERLVCNAPIDVSPEDNPRNEPKPDVVVLRHSFRELNDNAVPGGLELLVEVAATNREFDLDLTTKARLYARAAIAEYWVLDLPNRHLHVHRDPAGDTYRTRFVVDETGSVAPLAQPDRAIAVATLLPNLPPRPTR